MSDYIKVILIGHINTEDLMISEGYSEQVVSLVPQFLSDNDIGYGQIYGSFYGSGL